MKTIPLAPSAGLVLPSLVGGVLFWMPALLLSRRDDSASVLAYSVGMPLVMWLLWRVFVAECKPIAQRALIPLFTLVAVWVFVPALLVGPVLLMGQSPITLWSFHPLMTIMVATYQGSLFGLLGASIVLIAATVFGARHIPPSSGDAQVMDEERDTTGMAPDAPASQIR